MPPTIQPPTSRLPPIAKIAHTPTAQLSESLHYLHSLYRPQVRGSRRRRQRGGCLHPLASSPDGEHDDDDDDDDVQFDAFERAYAIRWLTALIAQLEVQQESPSPLATTPTNPFTDATTDTDVIIQQAASLLATCAGVAAAGKLNRRFSFAFSAPLVSTTAQSGIARDRPSATTIHVDLTDIPLDNHDYASVGAQTWGGACVLAEMIVEHPDRFGLGFLGADCLDARERPLRVLELGAGTGLVGLTVAKLLQTLTPRTHPSPTFHPRAIIVLTDFYPAVLANLQSNIDANFSIDDADHTPTILVHSHPLDWSSFSPPPTTPTLPRPNILSIPFDLVFGADIVYEAQHAVWIRDCLTSLLSSPDGSNEDPVFHLVIPLRPTHTFESSTIEEVFIPKDRVLKGSQRQLTILSKESVVCEAYRDGRSKRNRTDDAVEYVYYRIGWTL